jgi:hypothetical protein
MKSLLCHFVVPCAPRGLCVVLSQTQDDQSEETQVKCACGKEGVISRRIEAHDGR